MPALEWISINGFKSIKSIEKLPLANINVIIGANGSGKSNFISAFSFLHAIREGGLQTYVKSAGGADRLLHFGSKETEALSIQIAFANEINQYKIVLIPTSDDTLVPSDERGYYWNKSAGHDYPYDTPIRGQGLEAGISNPNNKGISSHIKDHLDRWRLYHFHDVGRASPMKKNAAINDNRFLRQDGSNLPAFLYFLRERHPTEYGLIRATVHSVAPFFDDFILEPLNLESGFIRLEWRHKGSDAYFDVSSFSDGTLRFIALATLFLQPESIRPSVIIVDEPELGLHPVAISKFAAMARSASVKSQIIVSTQSPLLLDQFEPEEVLIAERENGATVVKRLERPGLSEWLENYSLGELWEKNEFGGRPNGGAE